jgi:hypothetical protein
MSSGDSKFQSFLSSMDQDEVVYDIRHATIEHGQFYSDAPNQKLAVDTVNKKRFGIQDASVNASNIDSDGTKGSYDIYCDGHKVVHVSWDIPDSGWLSSGSWSHDKPNVYVELKNENYTMDISGFNVQWEQVVLGIISYSTEISGSIYLRIK